MSDKHTTLAPDDALVIIDMQHIFASTQSQWHVPGYADAANQVARLRRHFSGPAIWTRFVRDPQETGSWQAYYQRWSQCRLAEDDPAWDITLTVPADDPVITLPTFSKWGADLQAMTQNHRRLVMCGVATDCCVLATALGAVDAGHHVTLVTDACAGLDLQAHAQTLAILQLLAPMTALMTLDQLDFQ